MLSIEYASLSDRGRVRTNNEDACGQFVPETNAEIEERGVVFVVADGMGGHRGGEIASRIAVRTILAFYTADNSPDRSLALARAFHEANQTIIQEAVSDSTLFGMGTTCTAIALHLGRAYFAHVGDSRCYLLRRGSIRQITSDHSIVGEMVRSGILSDEDARSHPKRNVITRSLGAQPEVEAETPENVALEVGDTFLLCSDGLTTYLSNDDLATVLSRNAPQEACKKLIFMANEQGGRDNITAQIITIRGL
ncbi:MAG TPA: Stp1/IreP family PP2C-type Ser/Thr phosphatase [Candidatus Krumholzibacteria bacterium]|nr:Stp1/IreP family PP2C-type Ser/Thr phosphatase [Candidatus Krumholzibacteria bacterium]